MFLEVYCFHRKGRSLIIPDAKSDKISSWNFFSVHKCFDVLPLHTHEQIYLRFSSQNRTVLTSFSCLAAFVENSIYHKYVQLSAFMKRFWFYLERITPESCSKYFCLRRIILKLSTCIQSTRTLQKIKNILLHDQDLWVWTIQDGPTVR